MLAGVEVGDTVEEAQWLARKVATVRLLEGEDGRMSLSVAEAGAGVLLISQFTLFGSLKKGTKPSWHRAAGPEEAIPLYKAFQSALEKELGKPVPAGVFGADMQIFSELDGPVTLLLDTRNKGG